MQESYFVDFFSVAELIEMSDVNHVNILYLIGMRLLSRADKLGIPVGSIKRSLLSWMNTTGKEISEQETKSEMGVEADFLTMFQAKLQQERTFRLELEKTYERRITELVGYLDRLALAIKSMTKKPILVIIDDLDKLDLSVVEQIYRQNVKALFSPNFKIVFTIPVSSSQDPQVMGALNSEGVVRLQLFPVTKFFTYEQIKEGSTIPIAQNVELFKEVLAKRFKAGLIDPKTSQNLVLASGGVLRELVRIARECCTECMVQIELHPDRESMQIDDAILTTALKNLRNDFARQIQANYQMLVTVHKTHEQVESELFTKMLHGLMVLEYENGDLWYDVHPIILDLLRRKQLVD